jgi:deoxyribonuclease-1
MYEAWEADDWRKAIELTERRRCVRIRPGVRARIISQVQDRWDLAQIDKIDSDGTRGLPGWTATVWVHRRVLAPLPGDGGKELFETKGTAVKCRDKTAVDVYESTQATKGSSWGAHEGGPDWEMRYLLEDADLCVKDYVDAPVQTLERYERSPLWMRIRVAPDETFWVESTRLVRLPDAPTSFSEALTAAQEIYAERRSTFYCGCDFDETGAIDSATCRGARSTSPARLEWRHIIPLEQYGLTRRCWTQPERFPSCAGKAKHECCRDVAPMFRAFETDLVNLIPIALESSSDGRSPCAGLTAKRFAVEGDELTALPKELKGDVARTYLYAETVYGLELRVDDRPRFYKWNREDPPDGWEESRDRRIRDLQRQGNRFVAFYRADLGERDSFLMREFLWQDREDETSKTP